jgi:hypothetical protein
MAFHPARNAAFQDVHSKRYLKAFEIRVISEAAGLMKLERLVAAETLPQKGCIAVRSLSPKVWINERLMGELRTSSSRSCGPESSDRSRLQSHAGGNRFGSITRESQVALQRALLDDVGRAPLKCCGLRMRRFLQLAKGSAAPGPLRHSAPFGSASGGESNRIGLELM